MENSERDRVSQRTSPTDAGRINREVSGERGREQNSGTSAEFGQSIGRAENLSEGGEMRNKDNESSNVNRNTGMDSEQSRNSGSSGFGSSSGRSSGSSSGEQSSSISRDDRSPGRSGSTGSSEGRH